MFGKCILPAYGLYVENAPGFTAENLRFTREKGTRDERPATYGCGRAAEEGLLRIALTFDDSLKDHLLIAAPMLEARGWRGSFNIVTDWIGRSEKYLTWDDVRELIRRGHEVTTHTKTHPSLTRLLDEGRADSVRAELAESRDAIAQETGFAPRFLCTPYCQQNDETDRLCREANLRQMNVARYNFGSNNCDRAATLVEELTAKGIRRADFLHHGIAANEHGGWCPFLTRESFARHLDAIAALEREGRVIVTDYDGAASDCRLTAETWPHHGVVALSFDDRSFTDWRQALPLFAQYDARTTFCVCGEITDEAIAFMRQALAAGHEIALHGLRHRDADREISARGVEAYWQVEMEPQLAACHTNGIPVRSFAYPNCRRSPETDAAFLAKGFTRLRGRLDGIANPQPHDPKGERLADWKLLVSHDPSFVPAADCLTRPLLPNIILGENYHTRLNDILASCRRAGSRAECLSLVSHGISPDAKGISLKTDWLERILAEANDAGVIVRGLR